MKKKLLSSALILAALVGFNMSAQEPATTTDKVCTENTQCQKWDKNKDGKKGHRHGDCKEAQCPHAKKGDKPGQRPNLFEGITLTEEQQVQIDALRPQRPECKVKGDSIKCDKAKAEKCDKAKADGKDCDKKFKGDGRRPGANPAMRAEYVKKVKEILTPEQYVTFLENIVFMPQNDAPRPDGMPRHDRKGGPKGDKPACPEAGTPDQTAE